MKRMTENDKERHRELAELILAELAGGIIQSTGNGVDWFDLQASVVEEIANEFGYWRSGEVAYRLKPEPDKVSYCSKCGLLKKQEGLTPHNSVVCDGVISTFYKNDAISVT